MSLTTIQGIIKNPNGTAFGGTITFLPLSYPAEIGGNLVRNAPTAVATNGVSGAFSVQLYAGNYKVEIPAYNKPISISVPDDGGVYDLTEVATTPLSFDPVTSAATPVATSERSGKVRISEDQDDPQVPTLNYVNARFQASNVRFKARGGVQVLQALNVTTGLYHDLICQTVDGFPALTVGDIGEE